MDIVLLLLVNQAEKEETQLKAWYSEGCGMTVIAQELSKKWLLYVLCSQSATRWKRIQLHKVFSKISREDTY